MFIARGLTALAVVGPLWLVVRCGIVLPGFSSYRFLRFVLVGHVFKIFTKTYNYFLFIWLIIHCVFVEFKTLMLQVDNNSFKILVFT